MASPVYRYTIKPLPKPEYYLLKAFMEEYQLSDPTEAFAIALRVTYHFAQIIEKDGKRTGEMYLLDHIDAIRTLKEKERTYPLWVESDPQK